MNMKLNSGDLKYALQGSRLKDENRPTYEPLVNFNLFTDDPNAPFDDDDDAWALKSWRGPVLLLHGAGGNADTWFNHDALGPYERLPFILSDLGYSLTSCDTSVEISS